MTDSDGSSSTEAVDNSLAATLTPELKAELGLDGYEFNVMLRQEGTWCINDLLAEEETGDTMNDAVHKRNLYLEEKFGFTISAGYSADTYLNEINTLVLANDDTYDAYFPMARTGGTAASNGLLYDLNDMKYIDFEKSCWSQMFLNNTSINCKQYYAAGAISTNAYSALRVFLFNKEMTEDLQLDNVYDLVSDGKWTMDAFMSMAKAGSRDLNGDTVMNEDDDQFGMAWERSIGGNIFYKSCGENIVGKDKNDLPTIQMGSERSIKVYDTIKNMMADKDNFCIVNWDRDGMKPFKDGRALFTTCTLNSVVDLRSLELEFGILPSPKFDENQDEYISFSDSWCMSPIVVPKNVSNADRTGYIIQALAEASEKFLSEPYYKIVLEGKTIRDEESSISLDIVTHNFVLEQLDLYNWGGLSDRFRDGYENNTELTTLLATHKTQLQAEIDKTIEAITAD
ncbi:MAG: extracellular solute-binding protein [Clostridiales bacterium]|nr:extracellular solute-binding protein [Clostridiales bacterium]